MHKEYSVFFLICGMPEIILFCVEQTAALLCCYGDAIFIEDAVRACQFVNTEGQVVFMKEPINSTSAKYNFSSFHSPFKRMCKRNHIGFVIFILMISHQFHQNIQISKAQRCLKIQCLIFRNSTINILQFHQICRLNYMTAQDINQRTKCPLDDTPSRSIQVGRKVQAHTQNRVDTELRQSFSGPFPVVQKISEDRYSYILFQWAIKLILNISTPHHPLKQFQNNLVSFVPPPGPTDSGSMFSIVSWKQWVMTVRPTTQNIFLPTQFAQPFLARPILHFQLPQRTLVRLR